MIEPYSVPFPIRAPRQASRFRFPMPVVRQPSMSLRPEGVFARITPFSVSPAAGFFLTRKPLTANRQRCIFGLWHGACPTLSSFPLFRNLLGIVLLLDHIFTFISLGSALSPGAFGPVCSAPPPHRPGALLPSSRRSPSFCRVSLGAFEAFPLSQDLHRCCATQMTRWPKSSPPSSLSAVLLQS